MTEAIKLTGVVANDNAQGKAPGVIGGIKSLLCDGCGRNEAVLDGLCGPCFVEAETLIQERRPEWRGPRF